MDDNPDPTREDNSSIAASPLLDSSASDVHLKPTEAMTTGDGATAHAGPAIPDQEHAEAIKEASSTPQSISKKQRPSSANVARVHFLDPAELEKLEVAYKSEHNVEELNKHASQGQAEAEHGGTLPKSPKFAIVTKEPEKTAKTSGVDDGAVSEKDPKVGFKHDPDEERILANMELDANASSKSKKKKRKNRRRPKSQRGENAPSGFEPFYADAPITPAEFEENKKIYDPALPILDRIDEGIKRFLYKRRLEPYRRKVFLKYLQYGGVSVGPKYLQGVTPSELKEMTKEEAMDARCTTAIFPKRDKPYPITFNDVATGYLTGYFMGYYNPETEEDIKVCTDTMKNFFSYLLYHDVCPEQTEDLEKARISCDRSAKELWMNRQLLRHPGPGAFNRACSMLFGGYYFNDVDDPEAWTHVRHADPNIFTTDMARKAVKYGIAIVGNDRTARKFQVLANMKLIEAKMVQDIDGFEIISLEEPTDETIALYGEMAPDLLPLGRVRAKEFRDPARGPFDLAPWEKIDWDAGFAPTYDFEFFLEGDMFPHLLPGMKVIANVYETNFGQYFFDEILDVLPSNYKFMYNDWMMDYVEPAPIKFIPDEEEVARRRAKESIIEPPEPTPAEWALHMVTHELSFDRPLGEDPMIVVWQIIHALENFGWDLEEVKDLMGLVDPHPEEGKKSMRQGEPRPVRLSNEPPHNVPFGETPKERLDRTIGYFVNPERIKPVIAPEVIAKTLQQKKEQLEKQQAKKAAEALNKQKAAKKKGLEEQPCGGPTDRQATQISDEQKIAKKQEPKGQPRGGRTRSQGTQTSDEQETVKDQDPEGQPSRELTETSKETIVIEKNEETKG
ncbi:uncharacterized protein N7479_010681 [Penicillium vulpinum]|uniref:Argonaute complex, subunit Arb1 n=1 Tax=Penicillium vulpinum TaxID=29845 RepID=A0A1V6S851_9EURO|nr:uncharacterized protein N7479_010681 [Penicillium vulpinum]KAJ5952268.1 hypothetical protein N7479_010681 [Penicillium vulpinum]OQE10231.1 hypothetical protein PENVUL_c004G09385 [Penicillium vulpinum]